MPPSSAAPRRASEDAERSHVGPPAESVIGLFKTELIKPRGPWRTAEQVELATLDVDWFNHRRLYGACGDIPPAELQAAYYRQNAALTEAGHATT